MAVERIDLRRKVGNPLGLASDHRMPTQGHQAAIWECMLGTVYAANRQGDVRYFDYDYRAAVKWADLKGCDLRTHRYTRSMRGCGIAYPNGPGRGRLVLWRRVV